MAAIIANDVSAAVSRVRSGTLGNRSESSESGANNTNGNIYNSGNNASGSISDNLSKSRSLDASDDVPVDETDAVASASPSSPAPTGTAIDLRNIAPALAYRSPSRLVSGSPSAGASGGGSGSSSSSKVERVLQQSDAALLDAVNLANEFRLSDGDDDDMEGDPVGASVEE
jgi:hypothetical protein